MKLIFIAILAFCCINAHANTIQIIEQMLNEQIQPNEPGCSVAIIDGNEDVFLSKGLASIEYQAKLTSKTQMLTASTSKQFLGYAILALAKKGKIKLDENIDKYIPEFKNYANIKVYQLLNHTSGVRSHWAIFELLGKSLLDEYTPSMVDNILRKQNTDFVPNGRYLYSNGGYFLLTKIIENVTEQSFSQFMKKQTFLPLGMNDTRYFDNHMAIVNNRADGYLKNEQGDFYAIRTHSEIVGPGHLITTLKDFSIWAKHLIKINLNHYFKPLETFIVSDNGEEVNYFAGLFKESFNGVDVYHHAGYYENWRQAFTIYPDKGIGIISLCNRADISTNKLNYELSKELFSWSDIFATEKSAISPTALTGVYFNKALDELIDIRFHQEQLYYVGPTNSAWGKLSYNSNESKYKGEDFHQNDDIRFFEEKLDFHSPLISGEFQKLSLKNNQKLTIDYTGLYSSDDHIGHLIISKKDNVFLVELEPIGTFEFLPTNQGVWLDRENMSTLTFEKNDNNLILSLSFKHLKNLKFHRAL